MAGSVSIRRSILRVALITDVWSKPPNFLPIWGNENVVSSRQRYIAICRGSTTPLRRRRWSNRSRLILYFSQTASCTVRINGL